MKNLKKQDLLLRLAEIEAENARLMAHEKRSIHTPSDIVREIRAVCQAEQESFVVVLLNARQKTLAVREVARGSLDRVDVHPREIFRDAVRMCAHSIIIAHNHPSGDPEPSQDDVQLTARLVAAGKLMGIPVLDSIVVTTTQFASLASLGMM